MSLTNCFVKRQNHNHWSVLGLDSSVTIVVKSIVCFRIGIAWYSKSVLCSLKKGWSEWQIATIHYSIIQTFHAFPNTIFLTTLHANIICFNFSTFLLLYKKKTRCKNNILFVFHVTYTIFYIFLYTLYFIYIYIDKLISLN